MNVEGKTAFVTGANRGLGKAFAEMLLGAGARKVYAGARNPNQIGDPRLTPVKLDVTSLDDIAAASRVCADVTLLINNAGILLQKPVLAAGGEEAMRKEMDVNVFGVQRMMNSFAPIITANGGGSIVNMLSVVSLIVTPFNGTYCTTKHAALALTDGARIQLKRQNVHVIGVFAGFVDTDMTRAVSLPKASPEQIAERTLKGLQASQDYVFGDDRSEKVWHASRGELAAIAVEQQRSWDSGGNPWSPPATSK